MALALPARAADAVVSEIAAFGGKAVASYDSVADAEGARALVARAVEAFGGVDILVNNAGILRDKSFGKMDLEDFDAVVRVHLSGAAYCTQAAWPVMSARKYGRVVMTLSNSGLYGNFGQANYAAAKAGLIGLMNTLKIEGLRNNILVNAVAPMAATRMTEATMTPEVLARFRPEYPAAAVAYMCSESFSESGDDHLLRRWPLLRRESHERDRRAARGGAFARIDQWRLGQDHRHARRPDFRQRTGGSELRAPGSRRQGCERAPPPPEREAGERGHAHRSRRGQVRGVVRGSRRALLQAAASFPLGAVHPLAERRSAGGGAAVGSGWMLDVRRARTSKPADSALDCASWESPRATASLR